MSAIRTSSWRRSCSFLRSNAQWEKYKTYSSQEQILISCSLCNKNQLDALFILSLYCQLTSTCFGPICNWLSVGPANRQSTEKHNTYQFVEHIYTVYLQMMGYKYARNMYRLIDEINWGQIVHRVGFHYRDIARCTVNKT